MIYKIIFKKKHFFICIKFHKDLPTSNQVTFDTIVAFVFVVNFNYFEVVFIN